MNCEYLFADFSLLLNAIISSHGVMMLRLITFEEQ